MKRETTANKLLALLGIESEKKEELVTKTVKKNTPKNKFQNITEEEIQHFREAQGIIYFFKAPELFKLKTCPHCGADFLVSRLYVAYCSYTCIAKSMEEDWGVVWSKTEDIRSLSEGDTNDIIQAVNNLWEGNEPIWIRNLPMLQKALEVLVHSNSDSKSTQSHMV
jgi:hypothetical protein